MCLIHNQDNILAYVMLFYIMKINKRLSENKIKLLSDVDLFVNFLNIERGLSLNTIQAYQNDIYDLIDHLDNQSPVIDKIHSCEDFDISHFKLFIDLMNSREYQTSTKSRKIASIKSFIKFLLLEKIIKKNPLKDVKQPSYNPKIPYTLSSNQIEITELPVGTWTQDYKEFLEKYIEKNPKKLKDYESHYTENSVRFILHFESGIVNDLLELEKDVTNTKFEKEFKLITSKMLSTTNMHMFNDKGTITKMKNINEIIKQFYKFRLSWYQTRKDYIIDKLKNELFIARDRFGIKPLYYYNKGNEFVFASELKSILYYPNINREINFEALDMYLTMENVPAPFSIYYEIKKLEASHYLKISNDNLIIKSKY